MRPPKNDRARQPRRRGFDDDQFYGNTPSPASSFQGFGAASPSPEGRATVKWYNPEKGFGFVELTDGSGDAFLHVSALQAGGHQMVSPGATLGIRVGQGPKGRQVDQVLSVDENTAAQSQPHDAQGSRPGMQRPARAEVNLNSGVEMTGIVKWYNPTKGFGFITPENGAKDVFLHATAIERAGMAPPHEGQLVRMSVVQGPKGPEVGSISPG